MSQYPSFDSLRRSAQLLLVLMASCLFALPAAAQSRWDIEGSKQIGSITPLEKRAQAVLFDYERLIGDRSGPGADGEHQDLYGNALAIDGDTLVVGAPRDQVGSYESQGSVYIYVWAEDAWQLQAKLVTHIDIGVGGTDFSSNLGFSVAIEGDTLAVGAPYASVVESTTGAVFFFQRSGSDWALDSTIMASDAEFGSEFGIAIDMDGDSVVVGSTNGSVVGQQGGAAYVYTRVAGDWVEQDKLVASDASRGDSFGGSVSIGGDHVAIGSPKKAIGSNESQGAVYTYARDTGKWHEETQLVDAEGNAFAQFGASVSLKNGVVLIGAPFTHVNGTQGAGAAVVYEWRDSSWSFLRRLTAPALPSEGFGYSVALNGVHALIGTPDFNLIRRGTVHAYAYDDQSWSELGSVTPIMGTAGLGFGFAVALDETRAAVSTSVFHAPFRGGVYSVVLDQGSWVEEAFVDAGEGEALTQFGEAVAVFGDTALVGVPGARVNGNDEQGAVYVYVRGDSGWEHTQRLVALDGDARKQFGSVLAIDGDTAVVATTYSNSGNPRQGAAYVFVRTSNGWEQQAKLAPNFHQENDSFAQSIAIQGDTVLVGARRRNTAFAQTGAVFVFVRSDSMWEQRTMIIPNDGGAGDLFGTAVAIYGDAILVGASSHAIGSNFGQGAGYVFEPDGLGWAQQAKFSAVTTIGGLGFTAAIHGQVALLGGPNILAPNGERGMAFAFSKVGAEWISNGPLMIGSNPAGGIHGALAFNGERVIVGGMDGDDGVARVFTRNGEQWQLEKSLIAREGRRFDGFSRAVAMDAETALIGARFDAGTGAFANPGEGAAYLFDLDDETPVFTDSFE